MKPTLRLLVIVAGVLVICACGSEERLHHTSEDPTHDEHADEHGDPAHLAHGEVFEFQAPLEDQSERADFEAGADMLTRVITPEASFRGVKVMVTAAHLDLEYRLVRSQEATEWRPFEPEQSVDRFHNGHLALDVAADELHFRATSPTDYVRFEFYEDPVDSADAHDDVPGSSEDTRTQELAKPGRYQPPSSVRSAGLAQRGNFSYDSAPAYNGGRNCSGTFRPGARALGNFLVDHFDGAAYYQGYNCRTIRGSSGMSMHGTGRAIDLFVPRDRSQPYDNQADNDLGDPIANYLIENATELGIQYVIWDQAKWSISHGEVRSYGGVHPHHDHLHIELTRAAAANDRSQYPGEQPQFSPHFADDDGNQHEDAINKLYDAGVTRGCRGGSVPLYCPDRTLTRANMAVMFMRAFNLPRDGEDYFDDDDGSYAEDSINAMAYRGITQGCDPDNPRRFCPGGSVTRGQFALFLDRAVRLPDTTQDYFFDDDGSIYEDAANRLAAAGITKGCGSPNKYCGDEPITRAQLAAFLTRAMGLVPGYDAQEIDFVPYFADDDGSPHEENINLLYQEGIINGCDGGDRPLYCPDRDLSRGALAAFSARGFSLPAATTSYFDDIDGHHAKDHIESIAEAGLTHGCGGDSYCPDDPATLGQVALFLIRGADHHSGGQIDASNMSAEDAIDELTNWGAIQRPSCQDATDCAGEIVNRAQAASLFARVLSTIGAL